MLTSSNGNQLNMFGDEELLFDDELLLDEVTIPPNSFLLTARDTEQPQNTNITYPILLFARQESQQTILWPVYGWRIAAPQVKQRRLDFLQITYLRLARAGVTCHQKQAELLGLDKNLLLKVKEQLSEERGDGYIDKHGRLTEKGQKILQQNGEEEEERTVYGWIFQEATTGELLPWFHTDNLRFADSTRSDIAQTLQLPWIWQHLQPPDASNVTAAILNQRHLLKKVQVVEPTKEQNTEAQDACEFTESDKFIAPTFQPLGHEQVQLSDNFGVRFLNQQPQRFYLLVRAIIEGSYDGQFSLRCPFGLSDGLRWVRLLNFAASQRAEGSQLVEHLRQCSYDTWKRRQPPDIEPVAVGRQVYDQVVRELGPSPDKSWNGVWQELERMEQSLLLLERGFDEVDTAFTRSQRVLEQLMLTVLGLDSVPQDIWQKYNRQCALKECLRDTANTCGASVSDIPERLLTTSIGKVRAVLEGSKESLRPYVATFLLAASRRASLHRSILEHILRECPTFLLDIERVIDARNNFGAHAGGNHNQPVVLVQQIVQITYKVVRSLVAAWRVNKKLIANSSVTTINETQH